jgi:hypothetical protein
MKYLILTVVAISLFSCKKEEVVSPDGPSNRVLNYNLKNRVSYFYEPIVLSGKRSNSTQFAYVADVSAPVINGATLSATGIAFQGNKAFVSYHWNGAEGDFAGAIEVIDITNPNQPQLVSSLYFTDTDLNDIYVEGNKAYVVGGRSLSSSGYNSNLTKGGIVEIIGLNGGYLTTSTIQSWLPSFSGNSIFKQGNNVYTTSGNTGGGAFKVSLHPNNLLQVTDSDSYENSKFGVSNTSKFIFLEGGSNAKLHIHNNNNFNPNSKNVINLDASTSPLDGKGVLFVENNQAYVSGGQFGLFEFDLSNNSGTPVRTFITSGSGFVNGVGADNEFVFVAKGHEGMYILNRNDFVQRAVFSFVGSANYVAANGQNIFIANGVGGLKILSKTNQKDPFCTNETVSEPYVGTPGIVRLTAMGNYLENGMYGRRWRIRNETNQSATVNWDLYNTNVNGTFTVPANTTIYFTSHFTNNASGVHTVRLFENNQQIQVKAHGGSTKDLSSCK